LTPDRSPAHGPHRAADCRFAATKGGCRAATGTNERLPVPGRTTTSSATCSRHATRESTGPHGFRRIRPGTLQRHRAGHQRKARRQRSGAEQAKPLYPAGYRCVATAGPRVQPSAIQETTDTEGRNAHPEKITQRRNQTARSGVCGRLRKCKPFFESPSALSLLEWFSATSERLPSAALVPVERGPAFRLARKRFPHGRLRLSPAGP